MTVLKAGSSVTRETLTQYRHRPLIVELSGHLVRVREKGRRESVDVPIDAVYELGLKLRARQLTQQKQTGQGGR
jgi:hypothetical protein